MVSGFFHTTVFLECGIAVSSILPTCSQFSGFVEGIW